MFLVGLRRHYAVPGIRVVHPQTVQEPISEAAPRRLDETRVEPADILELEGHSEPPRSSDETVGEDVELTEIIDESARRRASTAAGSVQATERIRKSGRRQRRKKKAIATEGQEGPSASKVQQLCDEVQSSVTDSAASTEKNLAAPAQPADPTQAINSILHMLVLVSHPMDTANNTSTNPSSLQTVSAVPPPLTISPASPTKPDQFDPDFSSATSDQSTPSTTTSSLFAASSCAESQVSARTQTITHIDTALNPTAPAAAAEDKENAPPLPLIDTANNEATTRFPPVDLLPPGLPIANIYIHPPTNPISNTLFKPPLPVETISTHIPSPKSEAEVHAFYQQAGLQYPPNLYFPNAPFAPFATEHGYMVHPQQFNFTHEPVYIDSFMPQPAPESGFNPALQNTHHFAPVEYFAPQLPPPPPNSYTMNHQHYTFSLQTPTGFSERSFLAPPESCTLSSPQPPPPLSMHYGPIMHRHQDISPNNAYPGKILTDGFEQMAAVASPVRKSSFGSIGQGRVSNSSGAAKHAPLGATQYDVGWSLF
ncbi:hypothetical protein BJ741DRAFT_613413 [Chytriomyces cf. hyalinus JEL632]|nr:hypothetical protein BJ741DRAFT_613413 [Chytriomyces cf. hyalinus JEL632]